MDIYAVPKDTFEVSDIYALPNEFSRPPISKRNKGTVFIAMWLIVLTVVMLVMQGLLALALFKLFTENDTCSCPSQISQQQSSIAIASQLLDNASFIQAITSEVVKCNVNCSTCQQSDIASQLLDNSSFIQMIKDEVIKTNTTWTALSSTDFTYIILNANTTSEIQLSAIGVPSNASNVLVYIEVATGATDKNDIIAQIEVYSLSSLKQFLLVHGYISDDWAYNSDNLWVPIGTNRVVYARFNGNEPITRNNYARMKVIGYQ